MKQRKRQSEFTIPTKSVRLGQIVNLLFGIAELAAATCLYVLTDWIGLVVIFAILAALNLIRALTYPYEYRKGEPTS